MRVGCLATKMAASLYKSSLENLNEDFENTFKTYLSWSKKDWEHSSLLNSRIHKFIGFVRYWNSKIREGYDEKSLVLTLYNDKKECYINIEKILIAIQEITPLDGISGYYQLRNSRLLGLEFVSKEIKELVENQFKNIEENNVVFTHWANEGGHVNLTVHWLPRSIKKERLSNFLEKYINIISMENVSNNFEHKQNFPSGKYTIKGKLLKGQSMEDIPHLFYLGYLQGLITVKGRRPICLCCEQIGHIAYDCPTPFCKKCRIKKPRLHTCNQEKEIQNSYANIVKEDESEYLLDDCSSEGSSIENVLNEDKQDKILTEEVKNKRDKEPMIHKDNNISRMVQIENKKTKTRMPKKEIISNIVPIGIVGEKGKLKDRKVPISTECNKTLLNKDIFDIDNESNHSDDDNNLRGYKVKRIKGDEANKSPIISNTGSKLMKTYGKQKKTNRKTNNENNNLLIEEKMDVPESP